jgi:hypothetical protein
MLATVLVLVAAALAPAPGQAASGTSSISGVAFEDTDRDGIKDLGEPALADQGVYLLNQTGSSQLSYTATDASGNYRFSGLADGVYRVEYAPEQWWARRSEWVPTTTGSIAPRMTVSLAGAATADFGWRRIVRSTDAAAPNSAYSGPTGLTT